MDRRAAISAISLGSFAAAEAQETGARDQFIGVWTLISYETTDNKTGEVRKMFGPSPIGRITYDLAGRMSAQLMKPGRPRVGPGPAANPFRSVAEMPVDDLREICGGFLAYFGTYDVDVAKKTVIHHVQACLFPTWVGTDLIRKYEFSGNQLILIAARPEITNRLVWRRENG